MIDGWYSEMLAECEADGYRDAEECVFNLPYPEDENGCCADPGDDDINMAYRKGWYRMRRALLDRMRRELMAAGNWE